MVNTNYMRSKKDKLKSEKKEKSINKKQRDSFITEKLVEFCNRTDLHGFKYIVMRELNNFERSFWALAVFLSIVFAGIFVVRAYNWYARNPIVTVIESTHGPIWDVPFPAVTICDLNVVSRKAARAFANNNLTLPDNSTADRVYDSLRLIPLLYSHYNTSTESRNEMLWLQNVLDLNDIDITSLFRQLSPASSCNRILERCMWKSTAYRCEELFRHVHTPVGVCCTFNYFAVDDKQSANANENVPGKTEVPRRVASCGYQTALTVVIDTDLNDYYSSAIASQGALLFIDNPYNVPDLDSPVRVVNPATEVLIALSPEVTYATSGVKTFTPEQRNCYFKNEIKMSQFRQYTYHNCIHYRKIEIIRKFCECVPVYYELKGSYRTCNFHDMECLKSVHTTNDKKPVDEAQNGNYEDEIGKCLPECEHYEYPLEVAFGMLAKNLHSLSDLSFFNDIVIRNHSLLSVFFNDLVSTRYRRDVYLNWQNILAAFGGLLSLMLGFTLISGFDCILFFTFRIAHDAYDKFFRKNTDKRANKVNVREIVKKDMLTEDRATGGYLKW